MLTSNKNFSYLHSMEFGVTPIYRRSLSPIYRRDERRLRRDERRLRRDERRLRRDLRIVILCALKRPPTLRLLRDARRLRLFLRLRTTPTTPLRTLFAPEKTPCWRRLTPVRPLCFTDLTMFLAFVMALVGMFTKKFKPVSVSPLTAFSPALGMRPTRVKRPFARRPPRRLLRRVLLLRFAIF